MGREQTGLLGKNEQEVGNKWTGQRGRKEQKVTYIVAKREARRSKNREKQRAVECG